MDCAPVITVDARGLRCPWPVLRLAKVARDAAPGTVIELVADDPAAATEVPAYAVERGWSCDAAAPQFRIALPG